MSRPGDGAIAQYEVARQEDDTAISPLADPLRAKSRIHSVWLPGQSRSSMMRLSRSGLCPTGFLLLENLRAAHLPKGAQLPIQVLLARGDPRISNKGSGGRGGIRTHGTLASTAVFKTAALNHSATLPVPPRRSSGNYRRRRRASSCPRRFFAGISANPRLGRPAALLMATGISGCNVEWRLARQGKRLWCCPTRWCRE